MNMTVDDFIRLRFREFDLDEIFRETPEQAAKRMAAEITKDLGKEIRRALRKSGYDKS